MRISDWSSDVCSSDLAGTARVEGYKPADKPIVVVTSSGRVPESLVGAPAGSVLVATHAQSSGLAALRSELGEDNVLVLGESAVDLGALKTALADRGFANMLKIGRGSCRERVCQYV